VSVDRVLVDRVLAALADPTRRQLLETLGRNPPCSATTLAAQLPISRQAVVQHLAVLRESELVTSYRSGKEVLFTAQPERLAVTGSWMTGLAASWEDRLQRLKRQAELGQAELGQSEPDQDKAAGESAGH
jgi:DNA-binding transcriptional ArsR family regulator